MALRLVSSGDGPEVDAPALALRDHLLPIIRRDGDIGTQRDVLRLSVLRVGPWRFEHWTPFNDLPAGEASSPGYRHALERQRGVPDLPYGLDIWHEEAPVLSLLWSDAGGVHLVAFQRGPWEHAALAL